MFLVVETSIKNNQPINALYSYESKDDAFSAYYNYVGYQYNLAKQEADLTYFAAAVLDQSMSNYISMRWNRDVVIQ